MNTRTAVLFCLLTAICIAAVFSSSLFSGVPVSRFELISKLDILANQSLQGAEITVAKDPSACLSAIPKETFIQNSLSKGQLPIWNPLSGCGQSLISEPSNTLWSPLDLFFSPTNQSLYNTGIVIKIILGGIFSYLLFLRSGANPWAASTGALGWALSARVLRGAELSTNSGVLPAVFLIFLMLKPNARWSQVCLSAFGLAFCYAALHPEIFFVAVMSAMILWLLEFKPLAQAKETNRLSQIYTLSKVGIMTLALVAPLLFPFVENLKYAHCYKYDNPLNEYNPLDWLPYLLTVPKLAGTLFPGWVLLLGLPAGIIASWKHRRMLFPLLIFWILFSCRPFPLNNAFAQPPLSFLQPEYALGTILLLICLVASVGLTSLNDFSSKSIPHRIGVGITGLLLVMVPLLCLNMNVAPAALQTVISTKVVVTILAALLGSTFLLLCCPLREKNPAAAMVEQPTRSEPTARTETKLIREGFRWLVMIALPLINLCTLIGPAKIELPDTARVPIPAPDRQSLIHELQSFPNARITGCGAGILAPSHNLLYGLSDLRTCNPMNEARYLKFMNKLGGRFAYCNMMEVPPKLNRLIDLASVELLVSSCPLRSILDQSTPGQPFLKQSDKIARKEPPSQARRIMPGMRLVKSECNYTPAAAEIEANVTIRIHDNLAGRYKAQLVLRDEKNRDLWHSTCQFLSAPGPNSQAHNVKFNWIVPTPVNGEKKVNLFLLVHDTWTTELIQPDGISGRCSQGKPALELGSYALSSNSNISSADGRFSLLFETPDLLRIYRNTQARPRAYLVHKIIRADSEDIALQKISSSQFDPKCEAVLENDGQTLPQVQSPGSPAGDEIQLLKNGNVELNYSCKTNSPALFVLTDIYYPGWQAEVDGQPVKIYRTNYLFRGVPVQSGKHSISFRYVPLSFNLGLIAAIVAVLFALATCFKIKPRSGSEMK